MWRARNLRDPGLDEFKRHGFRRRNVQGTLPDARDQTRLTMMAGVPFIHRRQYGLALVNRKARTLGDHLEIGIGNEGGNLDDVVIERIESGHFKVDPDQMVVIRIHRAPANENVRQGLQRRI
jgi:hypothetical protein